MESESTASGARLLCLRPIHPSQTTCRVLRTFRLGSCRNFFKHLTDFGSALPPKSTPVHHLRMRPTLTQITCTLQATKPASQQQAKLSIMTSDHNAQCYDHLQELFSMFIDATLHAPSTLSLSSAHALALYIAS